MATLRELDGSLRSLGPDGGHRPVETVAEADGVMFICPKCSQVEGGGAHYVICWFAHVAKEIPPGPGRWVPHGTNLDDLTFISTPEHPNRSVFLTSGCQWHGFVENGGAN